MQRTSAYVLLLAAGVGGVTASALFSAPAPREAKSRREGASEQKIQGTWVIVRFEVDGEVEHEQVGSRCVIGADTLRLDDGPVQTFQTDPSKEPKQFDARAKVTKEMPFPHGMVGIYKVKNDFLTLCYRPPKRDVVRPTAFRTAENERGTLMVLKRAGR